jgi:hypothetical protein
VYVRYVDEAKVKEDLLFCKEIILSNKAQDLFDIINTYMTTKLLGWSDCVRLFTDRTHSMSGICCCIHRTRLECSVVFVGKDGGLVERS